MEEDHDNPPPSREDDEQTAGYLPHHHHHHSSAYESTSRHPARPHHHHSGERGEPAGAAGEKEHPARPHHHHSGEGYEGGSFHRPRRPVPGVVVAITVSLLVFAPLLFYFADRNEILKRENISLRSEVFRLTKEISATRERTSGGGPRHAPGAPPETPPEAPDAGTAAASSAPPPVMRTRGGEPGTPPPRPPAPRMAEPARAARRPPPAPQARPVTGLSAEEEATLCQELRLAPNGTAIDFDGAEAPARRATGCAPALETAFYALSRGLGEDAAVTLEGLVKSKPLWPYGHFYLGVATLDPGEFREAQRLLLIAGLLKAGTPEGDVYLVLASFFLKDTTTAGEALGRLESSSRDYARLPLGPLYVPRSAPVDLVKRLKALKGLPELHPADGRTGPR